MSGEWGVRAWAGTDWSTDGYELRVVRDRPGQKSVYLQIQGDDLVWTEYETGGIVPPVFRFTGPTGRETMRAITDALLQEREGFGSADHVRGELDATKRHLQDMRLLAGVVPSFSQPAGGPPS